MRFAIIAVVVLAAFIVLTSGPPAPTPNPPGTFSFAVLGDAPYYSHEELQFRVVRKDIGQHHLVSVIHVGDVFWRPCSDAMYAKSRGWLDSLRHPVIYTPGDNEWFDCWEPRVGAYVPLDRLAQLRRTYFNRPTRSLGRRAIPLVAQRGTPENARWRHGSIVFATVHMIGSRNGTLPFPGRTAADDAAVRQRTDAAVAWLRETFAEAAAGGATAVVLAFHANPFDLYSADYKAAYAPFLQPLLEEARRFGKPVLAVQGDEHDFIVDRPSAAAPNLQRLQVPGSPLVGWVRVTVRNGREFRFEQRVMPRWKYW